MTSRLLLTTAPGYPARCALLVNALQPAGDSRVVAKVLGITSPNHRQIVSRYRSGSRGIEDGNRLGILCKILNVPLELAINGPTEDLATLLTSRTP